MATTINVASLVYPNGVSANLVGWTLLTSTMSNNVITTKETVATSTTNIIDGEGLPLVAHSTNTNAASLQVFDATLHNRSLMGVSMHSLTAIVDANYTTSNSLSAQLRTSSGSVITSVSTTVVVGNYSTTQIIPELGVNKSYTFTGTYPNAYSLAYVGVYTNGSTYTLEPSLTFQLSGSQITATWMKGATTGILYPGATVKCTYKQNKCNWTFPATSTLLGGGGDIYVPAGIYFPKTIEYKVNIDKGTPDDYKNYISYTGMPSIIPPTSTLCTFFPQDATWVTQEFN